MAHVITIAQQKGGAGKSTLVTHLAVAFCQQGLDVAILDTDPQGSTSTWFDRRFETLGEEAHQITMQRVPGWRLPSELQRQSRDHDIVLIDVASGMDMDAKTAMRHGDLVIVPVQPSPADVWATHAVLDFAGEANLPLMLVMNRVTTRSKLAGVFRKKLPFLAQTQLGNRQIFASVLQNGLTVLETAPGSVATKEMRAFTAEVAKKLVLKQTAKAKRKVAV